MHRYGMPFGYIAVGITAATLSSVVAAAVEIGQVPLFVTRNADPNVLFVIDDSGSMQFESMPDELTNLFDQRCCHDYVMRMFPFVEGVHGASDYDNRRVPSFGDDDIMAAVYRASYSNALYYNPAITYQPWSRANGGFMADADPGAAANHPEFPDRGHRDLTEFTQDRADWLDDRDNSADRESRDYYPATYFAYTGPEVGDVTDAIEQASSALWNIAHYDRIRIIESNAPFTGEGRVNRSDCDNGVCTYQKEIQNFANWYTYHRSRIFAARAGIGRAFSQQPKNLRAGYGAINETNGSRIDGHKTETVIRGVRPFEGEARKAFFDELYQQDIDTEGTPLRRGLQGAGDYFERTDAGSPWATSPGTSTQESDNDHGDGGGAYGRLCRWWPDLPFCETDNDDDSDQDKDAAPSACRQSFTVLMTDGYWSGRDPYAIENEDNESGLSISDSEGNSYRYRPVPPYKDSHSGTLADVAMHYWKRDLRPDLDNSVPTSARDEAFWQHMVTFGIGLGVSGNIDPDTAFAALETGADISWSNPQSTQSAKIDDLLHAGVNSRGGFFSAANPEAFQQQLAKGLQSLLGRVRSTAASLVATSTQATGGTRVFQASFRTDDWSGEVIAYPYLRVGDEDAVQWRASGQMPTPADRNIWTYDSDSGGIAFEWNELGSDAQQALGDDVSVLSYLRGSHDNEGRGSGGLRQRDNVIGDIVHSSPAFVGNQGFGYSILPASAGSTYNAFVSGKTNKPNIIVVGANDGMLHAFRADTGAELFAYVPRQLFPELEQLTGRDYSHRYYVDGSPAVTDAYLDDAWRTVVVTTLGRGGRGLFALDVTNPADFGGGDVMWELSSANTGFMGKVMGKPAVVRLESGRWVALVGNGYNSGSGTAALLVLDLSTGEVLKVLDTGVGPNNGLSTPAAIDRDRDGSVDSVYAGDLEGNLWKFDFSGNSQADWQIPYSGAPLFTTEADSGDSQPITARPDVIAHPMGGVIVVFGTGRYLSNRDIDQDDEQSVYGVWDREGGRTSNGSELADTPVSGLGQLVEQTTEVMRTGAGERNVRVLSEKTVNYSNGSDGNKRGWYFGLQRSGERITRNVTIFDGKAILVSTIPGIDACDFGGDSALFEINPLTGTQFDQPVLDLDEDGDFDDDDSIEVGLGDDNESTTVYPGVVDLDIGLATNPYILNRNNGDQVKLGIGSNLNTDTLGERGFLRSGRASWLQLR